MELNIMFCKNSIFSDNNYYKGIKVKDLKKL